MADRHGRVERKRAAATPNLRGARGHHLPRCDMAIAAATPNLRGARGPTEPVRSFHRAAATPNLRGARGFAFDRKGSGCGAAEVDCRIRSGNDRERERRCKDGGMRPRSGAPVPRNHSKNFAEGVFNFFPNVSTRISKTPGPEMLRKGMQSPSSRGLMAGKEHLPSCAPLRPPLI